MQLEEKEINSIVILSPVGEMDLYNAPTLRYKVEGLITENKKQIIINLMQVSYIDSSGIGALIAALTKLKKSGGILKISNASSSIAKIFALTELTSFFQMFETEEEALKSFQ